MLDPEPLLIARLHQHGKHQKLGQACKHFLRENRRSFLIQAATHNSIPGRPDQLVGFGTYLPGCEHKGWSGLITALLSAVIEPGAAKEGHPTRSRGSQGGWMRQLNLVSGGLMTLMARENPLGLILGPTG